MLENILQLLEIAKSQKAKGEFIDIALGKYKYPETIKEAYRQFKREL
tara:strand:+ start:333 stop:473 length:141 start_codon:yes stop_codon:yes gene_type:complete